MPKTWKMLDLSTAHLQPHTGEWLSINQPTYPSSIIGFPHGWILSTHLWEVLGENLLPADIRECLEYAVNEGCEWVMFDADADIDPNLTDYSDAY